MNKLLKQFIREFNFERPDWGEMSEGFPGVDRRGLSKEEKHLLEAIEMAWLTSRPKPFYLKRVLNTALGGVTLSAVLMGVVMASYYLNVGYKLGWVFLAEFFA